MSAYAETRFRVYNEQIKLLVLPFESGDPHPVPFVCECRSEHCFAPVFVSLAEYEAICADVEHRLILPGHQAEGEQVVVETPTYAVVRLAQFGEDGWAGTPAESRGREPPTSSSGPSAGASRHTKLP